MDKPKALKLAEENLKLQENCIFISDHQKQTASELRRLHAENEQLKADVRELVAGLELAYREILVYRTPTHWSEYRNGALDMVKDAIEKHKGNL